MKLEDGMYVRTKYGIAKILSTDYTDDIVEDFLVVDKELEIGLISGCDWSLCDKKDVTKASFNIINLIEVGDVLLLHDIVNDEDYKSEVSLDWQDNLCVVDFENSNLIDLRSSLFIKKIDIKSIVTKEQFESMSYKVGD